MESNFCNDLYYGIYEIEKKNLDSTSEFFNIIKKISEEYCSNIRKYKEYTFNYYEKLSKLNFYFSPESFDNNNELMDLSYIFEIVNKVPLVIQNQIKNLKNFIDSLESTINPLEEVIKNEIFLFEERKKDFTEIYKKFLFNKKNNKDLMTKLDDTEKEIITYYRTKKTCPQNYEDARNNMISCIIKTKEFEKIYLSQTDGGKNYYYFFHYQVKDLIKKLKDRIRFLLENLNCGALSFFLYYKNCNTLSLKSIENELKKNELQSDITQRIIDNYIKLKEIKLEDCPNDKYNIKILNLEKNNNNNENYELNEENKRFTLNTFNIKKRSLTNSRSETRLNTAPFLKLKNHEKLGLVQKLYENFTMINKNLYNLEEETVKNNIKTLTDKLLSLDETHNINKDVKLSIKEYNKLFELMKLPQNRLLFLKRLNKIRAFGKTELSKNEFEDILRIFYLTLDKIEDIEKDILNIRYCIILSQTFYCMEGEKKYYLQYEIKSHIIFKSEKTWNCLIQFLMEEAKEKFNKFNKNQYSEEEIKNRYGEIAFGQLLPFANNMIEFGFDKDKAENICLKLMEQYNIKDEFKELILTTIKTENEG